MLSGHCQHLFDIPPHHTLASLHRIHLIRLHNHGSFLHPIPPSCSQLLDGICVLLAARFSLIHPPRRAGSHSPWSPSVTWFHRSPLGLWLGRGGKLFTRSSEGSIRSLVGFGLDMRSSYLGLRGKLERCRAFGRMILCLLGGGSG